MLTPSPWEHCCRTFHNCVTNYPPHAPLILWVSPSTELIFWAGKVVEFNQVLCLFSMWSNSSSFNEPVQVRWPPSGKMCRTWERKLSPKGKFSQWCTIDCEELTLSKLGYDLVEWVILKQNFQFVHCTRSAMSNYGCIICVKMQTFDVVYVEQEK